jgi:TRAP-type C4-dicarboxylate transport system substrate-binding protein
MRRFDWTGRTLLLAGVLAFVGMSAAAGPLAAAEFEFKFGSTNSNTRSLDETVLPFTRAIEAESKGRIAFDVRLAGGYGPTAQLLDQLESGKVDMALIIPSYFSGKFPRTSVMELPTIFTRGEVGSHTLWQLYEEGLVADDYKQFKVIGLLVSAPFGILVVDKNVASLRDLRGMRIRVAGAAGGLGLARLGLIPLGMPTDLLSEAFDKDWVDAMNSGLDTARGVKGKQGKLLIEQVSTLIDAQFSTTAQVALMNRKSYDSLPPELQAIIDRHSGLTFSVRSGRSKDAVEDAAKKALAAEGRYRMFAFSPEDKAEIASRIAPVFEDWAAGMKLLGIDGEALIRRARELDSQPSS